MESKNFIDNLSQKKSNCSNPENAIDMANSLELLSRDIYTDSQRFIYELLQNADDASNQSELLDVRIDFVNDYVIVSHKGEPFSKVDIESISSAGDGTKAGDNNKTGFKGIGFKSVFSHSNFVIIKSGDFCFKFDKKHWSEHWNKTWGIQSIWKTDRNLKQKDENLKMPWQIIPIWTELPDELKNLSLFQEYNVSTIIRYDKLEQLKKDLNNLFSESQIILFLRSKKVKLSINIGEKIELEKNINEEVTTLKRNGNILSEWLIKTIQFEIPTHIQEKINQDESPKKLKEAKQTEISFAIQLEKEKLKAVDKENRLIFTYLPTSINYDFPFLVNASFLTDSGRQHLHQDRFWNNWIFEQIPIRFFSWIAELASKNSKYNKQFLAIVPHKLFGNSLLENSFNKGFKTALEEIAFIPNLEGNLLKVKESVFDKTNISRFINPQTLINYINEDKNKTFLVSAYTPYLEPLSTLDRLGVEIFDINNLKGFFASEIFAKEHKLEENFDLISFLFEQSQKNNEDKNSNVFNEILRQSSFIFDKKEQLNKPSHIYFPSIEFSNKFSDDLSIIHESIVTKINANGSIKNWLEDLGVKEPTDLSFIEKTIIEQGETFVTKENAIEIGRYLFNAHKKGLLKEEHYKKLENLNILTKENSLILVSKSFLSDFYEPDLRIEKIYSNDIYISEKYFEGKDLKSEWKTFFIKIDVNQGVKWKEIIINRDELQSKYNEYFQLLPSGSPHLHYPNEFFKYKLNQISLIEYTDDLTFSKSFWQHLFQSDISSKIDKSDSGVYYVAFWGGYQYFQLPVLFNTWLIENKRIFPTTQKICLKASEVYSNDIPNIYEIAGKYLPIFDCESTVPPKWEIYLKFIKIIELKDYLQILSGIWKDTHVDEQLRKENQKRIRLIYEKLSLINFDSYKKQQIKQWSDSNKILAKNGVDFYYPKELSIVTVEGFRASNLAYTEKQSAEIIELLRLFGVKIIDKITPTISNSQVEITDLKTKLLHTVPLIALVSVEKSKNHKEWEDECQRMIQKLSTIRFVETTEIYLSYGNEDDKQKRSSYAENDNFYYVGKWYSPRVLDGLVEPLCTFLKIQYAERILTVLLLETFAGGIEYLKEKGFNTDYIPSLEESEIRATNVEYRQYHQTTEDLGKQGELAVFEKLKQIYAEKYNQTVLETETGFKIGNEVEVFWRNKNRTTTANHDFKIIELNKEIYIDSKATSYDKNVEKVSLYISGNELSLMEEVEKYLIARVYNATSENPTIEFVRLQIDNLTT